MHVLVCSELVFWGCICTGKTGRRSSSTKSTHFVAYTLIFTPFLQQTFLVGKHIVSPEQTALGFLYTFYNLN